MAELKVVKRVNFEDTAVNGNVSYKDTHTVILPTRKLKSRQKNKQNLSADLPNGTRNVSKEDPGKIQELEEPQAGTSGLQSSSDGSGGSISSDPENAGNPGNGGRLDTIPEYEDTNDMYGDKELAWPNLVGLHDNTSDQPFMREDYLQTVTKVYKARTLYKNIIILSTCLLLTHTGLYNSLDIRISIYDMDSVWIAETVTYYGFLFMTLLFIAPWIVFKLSSKMAIILGLVAYTVYVICTIYVHVSTVVLGRILLATGGAILWTALGCYVTQVGTLVSDVTGRKKETTIFGLFGWFYLFYHLAEVCSGLMSAITLYRDHSIDSYDPDETCGAFHCPIYGINSTAGSVVSLKPVKLYTLHGSDVLMCVLSVIAAALCLSKVYWTRPHNTITHVKATQVMDIEEKVIGETSHHKTDCSEILLLSTLFHQRYRQQLYLIPITIYSGLQQAFILWDFNYSYISCSLNWWMVAMSMVCHGAITSLCAVIFSHLVEKTGRIPWFVIGGLSHCSALLTLFLWTPDTQNTPVYFTISALWGIGNASWQCLLHSFYAVVFLDKDPEAAFASYHMWRTVGLLTAFIYNLYMCTYMKIFTLLSILTLSMIGYFAVEVPIYRKSRA